MSVIRTATWLADSTAQPKVPGQKELLIPLTEDGSKVRVDATFTGVLEVNLDEANDSVAVFGNDGTTNRALKTDVGGELQIDVLTSALPTGAATSANQTNGAQLTQITDGTDEALVTAAGELNVLATAQPGVDIGDVTVNNAAGASAVNIQDGGNSITVDGTVTVTPSGTQDVNLTQVSGAAVTTGNGTAAGSQRVTIASDNTAFSTNATVTNAAGASAVNIQDGGNTITVDGTVTANLGTIAGIALDATLTAGTQKTQVVVGTSTWSSVANITVAVAGTAQQGPSNASPKGVRVTALSSNTGSVYLGDSGVTNAGGSEAGIEVTAGGSFEIPVTNLDQLYVNADTTGDKVGVVIL